VEDEEFYINYFLNGRNHKIQINYKYKKAEQSGLIVSDVTDNVILTQYQICF
jgi:hypothetical protein